MNIKLEEIDLFSNVILDNKITSFIEKEENFIHKRKNKGSGLRAQKRELGLAREELARLKSEKCPCSDPKGVMGGPAFQWGLEHENRIKNCEKRISDIKAEITKLTQKQR